MKKPKIKVEVDRYLDSAEFDVYISVDAFHVADEQGLPTRKAAREWAKEWCKTVGAALMEKGK